MFYLMTDASQQAFQYPLSTIVLGVVGFIAAAGLGSIAWYNSKRPPGWKDKERPDIVPDINPEQQ